MQAESSSCVSRDGDPGCNQSYVNNPTLKSGTAGSTAGSDLQTAGSEAVAARWETLCPDVKRIIVGKLSLNDLGRVARLCRDFREPFLTRLKEEQARLIMVGHETFEKDMFSAIVRAFNSFLAEPNPFPNYKNKSWMSIDATGHCQRVSCDVAEGRRIDDRSFFIRRNWYEVVLLWKFSGSCNNSGSIRIAMLSAQVLRVYVSEGAGEVAMGLLLAMCAGNPDARPAFSPLGVTTLRMEGLQGGARKREAEDLVGPLKAMAHTFSDTITAPLSESKVRHGPPLGHLQLG